MDVTCYVPFLFEAELFVFILVFSSLVSPSCMPFPLTFSRSLRNVRVFFTYQYFFYVWVGWQVSIMQQATRPKVLWNHICCFNHSMEQKLVISSLILIIWSETSLNLFCSNLWYGNSYCVLDYVDFSIFVWPLNPLSYLPLAV